MAKKLKKEFVNVNDLVNRVHNTLNSGVDVEDRTIYIVGEISEGTLGRFLTAFQVMDSTMGDIRIVLSSMGGDPYVGFAIYDAIIAANNRVILDAIGPVWSAAIIIYLAGDYRRATENARLMVHDGVCSPDGGYTVDKLKALTGEIQWSEDKYIELLARHTKQMAKYWQKCCNQETYISATEGVELGLVHKIIEPTKKVE